MTRPRATAPPGRGVRLGVAGVGAVLVGGGLIGRLASDRMPAAAAVALIGLVAWVVRAALPVRRSAAADVLLGIMIVCGSAAAAGTDLVGYAPALVGVSVVVSDGDRPRAPSVGAVLGSAVLLALGTVLSRPPLVTAVAAVAALALVSLASLNRRRTVQAETARRAALEQLVVAEQERGRVAALEERARLARDLHDVLAHSLGGLVVQLGALEAELDAGRHDAAAERARGARELATTGLGDARRAVAALRVQGSDAAVVVRDLVARHRDLGGDAILDLQGTSTAEPDVVEVVRMACLELLTNARRHAPGVTTTVTLDQDDGIRLIVTTPRTAASPTSRGGGHGLRGLRERVESVGGTVRVTEGDPFTVTVEVLQ
ncbi:histidine kinase [Isoptericola sp. F-RaC21]|uniref:sensor histidine kinase n=1 Tax=Isoptericola sp. F-RaC21 TaxID=3141452 RepID=UPI00315B6848